MGYNKDTRTAYTFEKAKYYNLQQTKGLSWIRFTTWRERTHVAKCLAHCSLTPADKIIDLPCGTGVMGRIFKKLPFRIFACDISPDMMSLAKKEYGQTHFGGFVQADIVQVPFKPDAFDCVISIGLMHRLPEDIRRQALNQIALISNNFIVISYSTNSFLQHLKRWLLRKMYRTYKAAPFPISLKGLKNEIASNKLQLVKKYAVIPFLSAEVVLLLKKL